MDYNNIVSSYGSTNHCNAHFYPASGFPVDSYQPFLTKLAEKLHISSLHLRPTWQNSGKLPKNRSWQLYADDLINYLEATIDEPIIAIGHSLGSSSTVMATIKRPDLFKALVLIESTQVPKLTSKLIKLAPKKLLKHFNPAKNCHLKQDTFHSKDEFYNIYRSNRAYKRISDENLQIFAEHALQKNSNGTFSLVYKKDWETISYMAPPFIMEDLCKIDIPTVAVRGKPSVFLSEDSWKLWQQKRPKVIFKENLAYGHLFPLEAPETCATLVLEGLEELGLLI